jgi:hypothetical protein
MPQNVSIPQPRRRKRNIESQDVIVVDENKIGLTELWRREHKLNPTGRRVIHVWFNPPNPLNPTY